MTHQPGTGEELERLKRELEAARAEAAIARGRVAALIGSVMDAVVMLDASQKIVLFNPAAERMFGYTAEEVMGQAVELLMPQRFRDTHAGHVRKFGASGATTRRMGSLGEVMGVRRDGSEFPIEASISHSEIEGSRRFTAILRDVSERRAQEQEKQLHIDRLDLLSQITKSITGRLDLDSLYPVVLRHLCEQFGTDYGVFLTTSPTTGEELTTSTPAASDQELVRRVGLSLRMTFPRYEGGLHRALLGEVTYVPDTAAIDLPLCSRLSTAGLGSAVAAPLGGPGDAMGILVVARTSANGFSGGEVEFLGQLADHVALAARQLRLLDELQRAYEDLKASQRTVTEQERMRAMGQMASGIAHDINNALGPITLYSETLLDTEANLSERARRFLQSIANSSDAIAKTVSRLREFYRQREEKVLLGPVRLNEIVKQVVEITRPRWRDMPQQKGVTIDLVLELGEPLAEPRGSDAEIRDALVNVVFNAVDAMPGGGRLIIRTGAASRGVCVEIADTGVGMDGATRSRCLDPFFTTKGERGTGLGLSMVFGMVQRHEGDLQIDSAPGRGTTIRIVLPMRADTPAAEASSVVVVPARALNLLCIDDDPSIRESLLDTLGLDGHRVTTAEGGAEGIELFRAAMEAGAPFDAVITDVGMPRMDGRQVAAKIKALSPSTPVLFLTGWGEQLKEEAQKVENVDEILSKPPRLRQIREALGRVVR